MQDKLFGNHDAFNISAVAYTEKHVGDAGGRGLFKGGQDTPDPVDLFLHAFLFFPYQLAVLGVVLHGMDSVLRGVQADVPELMDHVAFGVPVLVLAVTEDLDELFEDGGLAAVAPLGELGRVMVVAVDAAIVFVVAVLGAEDGGAEGTGEVVDVVLAIECSYV